MTPRVIAPLAPAHHSRHRASPPSRQAAGFSGYRRGSGLRSRSGARGTTHPHTSSRDRALRGQVGGVLQPHPHLLAHEFQGLAANRALKPTRWTVVPAGPAERVRIRPPSSHPPHPPPGGPAASAWLWHPAQNGVQDATTIQTGPRRMGSVCFAGVSGVSPGRRPGLSRRLHNGTSCSGEVGSWPSSSRVSLLTADAWSGAPTCE